MRMTLRPTRLLGRAALCALPTLDVEGRTPGQPAGRLTARQAATGTRTATPVIGAPRAISVITRGQMDLRQAQVLAEAMRFTPGGGIRYIGNTAVGSASLRFDLAGSNLTDETSVTACFHGTGRTVPGSLSCAW